MLLSPSLERSAYAAITLALLLAVHGLLANWNSETLATQRIYEYLRWSALTLVIATAFARTLNWRVASGLLLVWLLAHVALVGVVPVLSVALLALAALGIGARLGTGLVLHPAVLMLLGLALVTAVAGWLLPFPVHRMWWYIGGHRLCAALGHRLGAAGEHLRLAMRGCTSAACSGPGDHELGGCIGSHLAANHDAG